MKYQATVVYEMGQVRVLGGILLFVRHMDQQIEASRVGISIDERLKLLPMEFHQLMYGFAKDVQKAARPFTIKAAVLFGALDFYHGLNSS